MKKMSIEDKQKIFGGLSFWSFAMGASLIFQVLSGTVLSIVNLCLNNENNQTINNNNKWSSYYNGYNPGLPSIGIRYGLNPSKSSLMMF